MVKKHLFFTERRQLMVALGDGLILFLSLLAAVTLSQALGQNIFCWESPLVFLVGSCLPFSLLALHSICRGEEGPRRPVIFSARFLLPSSAALLLFVALGLWFRSFQPLTIPLVFFMFSSVTLSAGWHYLAGAASLTKKKRMLFIGDDPLMAELVEVTKGKHYHPYELAGSWSDCTSLETADDFLKKIHQFEVKCIVYSNQTAILPQLAENLLKMRFKRFPLYDAVSFYQKLTGALPVYHMDEQKLLALSQREFFSPRLAAVVKRTADIFLTLLLLPLALPVLLISALAIKLDSQGPILFIQERLGLGGKPFKLLKLRTMVVNAENNMPQWCKDNDPRITRVGKILRKLRLDELPQLLNILKNDMSLVGPRPIRRHFTDLLAKEVPFYQWRLLAKPGLTGWAQVHAGHANTIAAHAQMLQYDLFYLIHQSLCLDLIILFKTVLTILYGKGR
jgi:exopolysaccharide biosynthesis polyprenyl glycosylphosphotransferase